MNNNTGVMYDPATNSNYTVVNPNGNGWAQGPISQDAAVRYTPKSSLSASEYTMLTKDGGAKTFFTPPKDTKENALAKCNHYDQRGVPTLVDLPDGRQHCTVCGVSFHYKDPMTTTPEEIQQSVDNILDIIESIKFNNIDVNGFIADSVYVALVSMVRQIPNMWAISADAIRKAYVQNRGDLRYGQANMDNSMSYLNNIFAGGAVAGMGGAFGGNMGMTTPWPMNTGVNATGAPMGANVVTYGNQQYQQVVDPNTGNITLVPFQAQTVVNPNVAVNPTIVNQPASAWANNPMTYNAPAANTGAPAGPAAGMPNPIGQVVVDPNAQAQAPATNAPKQESVSIPGTAPTSGSFTI